MATRRARFKPVLSQTPRRGRSAATDIQTANAVKEATAPQEQSDKNSCTFNTNPCNAVNKPDPPSSSVIKNLPKDDSSTTISLTANNVVEVLSQPSTAPGTPVPKDVGEEHSVPESPKQGSTPVASSSKQDAASAGSTPSQLPSRAPPRRHSSPGQSSSKSSPATKNVAAARSSKDERVETASSARPRRQPSTMNQRALAARRNLMKISKDGPPQRSTLTMFDLIFYNPVTNPMSKKSPPPAKIRDRQASVSSVSTVQEQRLEEEKVDDVDDNQIKELEDKENKEEEKEEETAVAVPRVKVGPDGRIVIDEQSLVIETTESKKNREVMDKSEVVFDTGLSNGFYKRSARSKDWSNRDTLKFYRALHVYGTDFSLMQVLFKDRTRKELKLKFKKEEKIRMHLIDKALCSPLDFDTTELEQDALKEEEEEAARLAKEKEAKEKVAKEKLESNKPKPKPVKNRKPCSLAQKEMVQDAESCSSENVPPPKKKKIVRKSKSKPATKPKADNVAKQKSALDYFDDVVLPTDAVVSTSANKKAPAKATVPKKRKALPQDPNKPPKKSKKKVQSVELHSSPESDHTYAVSPFRTPQTPGTPAAKTPTRTPARTPSKKAPTTPVPSHVKNEMQSPGIVTIDVSNHVLSTPSPTRTVTMFPNEYTSSQLRTPKPMSISISHGSPYDYGPAPNRAVPVPLPTSSASSGVSLHPTPSPVEPGSFYVLQTQCPDDPKRHVLGVYMVTNKESNVMPPPTASPLLVQEALIASRKSEIVRDSLEETVLTKL